MEGGHRAARPAPGAGPTLGRAWLESGHAEPPLTPLLRLYNPPDVKTLNIVKDNQKEVRSRRHRLGEIRALPDTLPERGIDT